MLRRVQSAIFAIGLVVGGCVAHSVDPLVPSGVVVNNAPPAANPFAYSTAEISYKNAVLDEQETHNYLVRHIRFPSIGDNGQPDELVTGHYYQSKLPGKKPLVIVLPLWGGNRYPSRRMTTYLKRHSDGGVHVFNMLGEQALTDWSALESSADEEAFMEIWRETVERQRITVIDIRRTIDWASARPEIDPDRIALVAFSRSALMGALVLTNDDRLAASALVMGGAHPQVALAQCPMLEDEGAQQKVRHQFGWTLDEFRDRLEPLYHDLDPANYPGRTDPSSVLIVEAGHDRCFPATAREALFTAVGRPMRIVIPAGHKRAFLSMTPLGAAWLQKRIWEFLEETLQSGHG